MNLCEKIITDNITADCNNPMFSGVDAEAIIINKSHVSTVTYDENNGNIVTDIKLATSTKGYIVQQLGNQPFNGSQVEMADGVYNAKFNSTVQFAVMTNDADTCHSVIDNLANGRFVMIMKNEWLNEAGDNRFQIYGLAKGLKATSITRELWGDSESAYIVTLVEEGHPKSGTFVWKTDAETTEALIEGLTD